MIGEDRASRNSVWENGSSCSIFQERKRNDCLRKDYRRKSGESRNIQSYERRRSVGKWENHVSSKRTR